MLCQANRWIAVSFGAINSVEITLFTFNVDVQYISDHISVGVFTLLFFLNLSESVEGSDLTPY